MSKRTLGAIAGLACAIAFGAFVSCNSSDNNGTGTCPPQVPNSCGLPGTYCAANGQCMTCPVGSLNCDGVNTNACEAAGTSCGATGQCPGCSAPSCCVAGVCHAEGLPCGQNQICSAGVCGSAVTCGGVACQLPNCCEGNVCYQDGLACGASGKTCSSGTCSASSICGQFACSPPSCCHQDTCYQNSQPCGSSGLTCNSGTCGSASMCGGVACGAPSCCRANVCYQDGQSCGPGLTCANGSCQGNLCGGAVCSVPDCCFNNTCIKSGQGCGTTGEKCNEGVCKVPGWNCTMDPGGGKFSTVHSDGCKWKWTCPTEGNRELYCETISTKEHTCSCKKDGVEERRFKSVPICGYDSSTIATQVNADCGWNLPTP